MMKLYIHPSILNIFIYFSEYNAHMMPFSFHVNKYKKEYKTQFSKQSVECNKFDWRIMQNWKKTKQNYSYNRKYCFKLIDSYK